MIANDQVGTEGTPKSPGDESKTAILAHPFKVTSNPDHCDLEEYDSMKADKNPRSSSQGHF